MVHVKVCGVTCIDDALGCAAAGASALGLNFVLASPRCVTVEEARAISRAVGRSVLVVGVVANLDVEAMLALRERAELGCLQLHGDEPPEALVRLLPHAYKALRIASAEDVARASVYAGEYLLADARVPSILGGSGRSFDWSLVIELARTRKLTLAGGLTPDNVARAVRTVGPYCVDVASGVEADDNPRRKDMSKVERFVAQVRTAG